MALWDDLKTDVYTWTNRPAMVAETELALRQAIRTAHRQGKFWRDIVTTLVSPPVDQIQSFSLSTYAPRFRQIAAIKSNTLERYYKEAAISDLVDNDGYVRNDVYWGIGDTINIRALAPQTGYIVSYYQQPITTPPESIGDWLLADYKDVVVLIAAGTVLGLIGEQEIKQRVDALTAIAVADLISDNLEVTGR